MMERAIESLGTGNGVGHWSADQRRWFVFQLLPFDNDVRYARLSSASARVPVLQVANVMRRFMIDEPTHPLLHDQ
jgi:hypothetical protein